MLRGVREVVEAFSFYQGQVRAEEKPVFYLRGNHEIRNAYSLHLRRLLYYMGDKTYGAFNWEIPGSFCSIAEKTTRMTIGCITD